MDKIFFFNISLDKTLLGQARLHPKSDLMLEEIVGSYPENKKVSYSLKKPLDVVAIWISVDGDDNNSSFATEISEIKLIKN
ncbi:MAG: hypothetical protein ACLGGX_09360 [Bdellovibrionia bacterium]